MSETNLADFNLWIAQTTQLLREQRWTEIDVAHLIEEIEDLGKSETRNCQSTDSSAAAFAQVATPTSAAIR